MKPAWRVLVLPGGTEIGLEIRKALAWCKEVELFSAGAEVSNHAPFAFARHSILPGVEHPRWRELLVRILEANAITHVFPAHDELVVALAEAAPSLPAKVVGSPAATCRITRSKRATLGLLAGLVPVPKLYPDAAAVDAFPVFVKPDRGQGSLDVHRVHDAARLGVLLAEDPSRLVMEYLPGAEYTVDCFSDRGRGLLYCRGRERRRTRAGIAMASAFVEDERFQDMARRICGRLELHGAWFFQVRAAADGTLKLLEVAPRIAGTSSLSRAGGVNLPMLSLYEAERVPVQVVPHALEVEIDRALANRYRCKLDYRTLYVDFDDTLVVRGQVNPEIVRLLFQALNRGVKLVLLSRHDGDLERALHRYRLHGIFDHIVHLGADEAKADHLADRSGLLIDDSFAERAAATRVTGIAVADASMVELFLDERI